MGIVEVRLKKRRIKRDIIKNKSEQAKKNNPVRLKEEKRTSLKNL